jgi:hypothetical protein
VKKRLFPRLPTPVALSLAEALTRLDVANSALSAATAHADAVFAPTGGSPAGREELQALRETILAAARECGFPGPASADAKIRFDRACAALLHRTMSISAHEASQHGVWAFVSCVLAPDIVAWRWDRGDARRRERYMGGVRNTFGRLWWRAETLMLRGDERPYRIIESLGEDEIVQFMERPLLAAYGGLIRASALAILELEKVPVARSELQRDLQKRLLRAAAVLAVEHLDAAQTALLVRHHLALSLDAMRSRRTRRSVPPAARTTDMRD